MTLNAAITRKHHLTKDFSYKSIQFTLKQLKKGIILNIHILEMYTIFTQKIQKFFFTVDCLTSQEVSKCWLKYIN